MEELDFEGAEAFVEDLDFEGAEEFTGNVIAFEQPEPTLTATDSSETPMDIPEDTQATMSSKELEASGHAGQLGEQLQLGVASTFGGAYQGALDLADMVGIDVSQESELNLKTLEMINTQMKAYGDDSMFSPSNVGEMLPSLATLPVAYASKLAGFVVEGSIAYADSRGSEAPISESLTNMVIAGGLTAGSKYVFDYFAQKGPRALQMVKDELGVDDKALTGIYTRFGKVVGKDVASMTDGDKAVALLSQGKDKGAAILHEIVASDFKAQKAMDALHKSKVNAQGRLIGEKANVAKAIKPILEQKKFASQSYAEFKNFLTKAKPSVVVQPDQVTKIVEALADIPELSRQPIANRVMKTLSKKLESGEAISMEDLFDAREAMNAVTLKTKNVDKKTFETMKGQKFIDSMIEANMPESGAKLWSQLKGELKLSYALGGKNTKAELNNVFGSLLSDAGKGKMTYKAILDNIYKTSGNTNKLMGRHSFNQIRDAIGSVKMEQFERGLVKEIMEGTGDDLGKTIDRVDNLGFVTPEGKALKKELKALDRVFSSDDYYKLAANVLSGRADIDGTSITANLLSKLKYTASGASWNWLKKLVPTEKNKFIKNMDHLTKMIGKTNLSVADLRGVNPSTFREYQGVVRESIQNTIDEDLVRFKEDFNLDNAEVIDADEVAKQAGDVFDTSVIPETKQLPGGAKQLPAQASGDTAIPMAAPKASGIKGEKVALEAFIKDHRSVDSGKIDKIVKSATPDVQATPEAPLYRGMRMSDMEFQRMIDSGEYISRKPDSFSTDLMSAKGFTLEQFTGASKGKNEVILVDSNGKGVNLGEGNQFGVKSIEDEVLVPKGTKYKIKSTKKEDGRTIVEVEQL